MILSLVYAFQVQSKYIKDEFNRTRLFRGFNIASNDKVPHFKFINGPKLLNLLKITNSNLVRFPFIWEAYEPNENQYNQEYLDYYTNIVNLLGKSNISIILDFHQDGYSRFSLDGCGEGFPYWMTIHPQTPNNKEKCTNWQFKMTWHQLMRQNFNRFMDNVDLQLKFIKMAKSVISHLNHDYLLGIDILNEPVANEVKISQFHQLFANEIKSIYNGILFTSPNPIQTTTGIKQTNLQQINYDQLVYAPHYYKPLGLHSIFVKRFFQFANEISIKWNKPWFLLEFGTPPSNSAPTELQLTYDLMDAHLISGTQWTLNDNWNDVDKDGWNFEDFSVYGHAFRNNYVARPYPIAISGYDVVFEYHDGRIWLKYTAFEGLTEIAIPRQFQIIRMPIQCHDMDFIIYCKETESMYREIEIYLK
eukprot:NODE_647_length_5045_cov_0.419733.p2 type:complete len:418 gc:universal NODE_647_length_5045_cov_0.419733:4230-2977(-)